MERGEKQTYSMKSNAQAPTLRLLSGFAKAVHTDLRHNLHEPRRNG